jgi:DNA-binding NarL/FixJ family response regulator
MMTACVAPCSWAGASALADQVRVIARSAHLTPPGRTGASGTHRPLGLTSRELEVLGMVADGWSNKRIATALYVSPKTVSVHVSNILAKLGVASRGEAAAVAHRSGLVQS